MEHTRQSLRDLVPAILSGTSGTSEHQSLSPRFLGRSLRPSEGPAMCLWSHAVRCLASQVPSFGLFQSLLSFWADLRLGLWHVSRVGVAPGPAAPWGWNGVLPSCGPLRPTYGRMTAGRFYKQQQICGLFPDSEGRVEGIGHLLPPLSQNSCGKEGEQSQQGSELGWKKESGFNPLCVCMGECGAACTVC